jgi:hypothetical protein
MTKLTYIGQGNFVPNVPARDLSAEEVKEYGGEVALLETGLYEKPEEKTPRSKTKTSKDNND